MEDQGRAGREASPQLVEFSCSGLRRSVTGIQARAALRRQALVPKVAEGDALWRGAHGSHTGSAVESHGGQPHLHGDPFGDEAPTKCLYGPSNYTGDQYGETGHPPLMGFGADGILPPLESNRSINR